MASPYKTPYAFEQLTVGVAASGLTAAVYNLSPTGPKLAVINTETNPLRYRADGTDPTAAIGVLISPTTEIRLEGIDSVRKMRMIRSGAADATINVHYYQ